MKKTTSDSIKLKFAFKKDAKETYGKIRQAIRNLTEPGEYLRSNYLSMIKLEMDGYAIVMEPRLFYLTQKSKKTTSYRQHQFRKGKMHLEIKDEQYVLFWNTLK